MSANYITVGGCLRCNERWTLDDMLNEQGVSLPAPVPVVTAALRVSARRLAASHRKCKPASDSEPLLA